MTRLLGMFLCVLASSTMAAVAHEFWLSPDDYTVTNEDVMQVRLRVGTEMNGPALPYLPKDIVRFDVVQGALQRNVTARMGDDPALLMPAEVDGLAVVVHQTQDLHLTYPDLATFQRFVAHKDLRGALEAHAARGLPDAGFQETYRRHAKSLIAVGSGSGGDRAMGLTIEIVALANPYTDDMTAGLPLLVLLDAVPRADVQVEVFGKAADGTVTIFLYRTDAAGRVRVPVVPGVEYLIDSVALRPLDTADVTAEPVWHSDWASLTFRVPD